LAPLPASGKIYEEPVLPTTISALPIPAQPSQPEPSGAIAALYWVNDEQVAALVDYGPEDLRSATNTICLALAEAATSPLCTPELVLSCLIFESVTAQDTPAASTYAAALAQYVGWRFVCVQETHEHDCFIVQVPAKDREDFEVQIMANLKLVPGPLGREKLPPAPEDLVQGLRHSHGR
jgi:hypothetical protein